MDESYMFIRVSLILHIEILAACIDSATTIRFGGMNLLIGDFTVISLLLNMMYQIGETRDMAASLAETNSRYRSHYNKLFHRSLTIDTSYSIYLTHNSTYNRKI